jgi:hypothetical protein
MPVTIGKRRAQIRRRFSHCPIDCPIYLDNEIVALSDFFAVFHVLLEANKLFWFRGHSNVEYKLAPSALRYVEKDKIDRALAIVTDMKRYLEMKLLRPPSVDDELGWMQVAQHYGLPTRLLDWTQNAAVALFFACRDQLESDGLVVILNPIELNQMVDPQLPRIFNLHKDQRLILPYFKLGSRSNSKGRRTIAINPTWNTERIALQHGAFTLHGSRSFELDRHQASSLLYVPILREHKQPLLQELERVGIGEMFIFPEPEHVCAHLRRSAGL